MVISPVCDLRNSQLAQVSALGLALSSYLPQCACKKKKEKEKRNMTYYQGENKGALNFDIERNFWQCFNIFSPLLKVSEFL